MPKVAQSLLEDFGKAVKRARSLRGWQLDQLSAAMEGAQASRSYLSNLEKGQRQISPPTVGRLIKALDLDESWIDKFLDADVPQEAEETPVDRETERLLNLKAKDTQTPDASEDLLMLLANTHAGGQYTDTFTAYNALRAALEAAERIRQRGEMRGNLGDQLNDVLAEVARLNAQGRIDEGNDLLEAEQRRMQAEHRSVQEYQAEQARAMLTRLIDQDRLRNQAEDAAKRLIADLRAQPDRGKLVWAVNDLAYEWRENGDRTGDMFALRVALHLARANYDKYKGKRGLEAAALRTLGWCYFRLAERSTRPRDLDLAGNAFAESLRLTSQKKDPANWAARQDGLASVLQEKGERARDAGMLHKAVAMHREAVAVQEPLGHRLNLNVRWDNLGNALRALGEVTQDAGILAEGLAAYDTALGLLNKGEERIFWEGTQNNRAVTLRWLGAVTGDLARFDQAQAAYDDCAQTLSRETAAFVWARLHWNLADLALARFAIDPNPAHLDTAQTHATQARDVFVEGSDHQTTRCDELIARITAARAAL